MPRSPKEWRDLLSSAGDSIGNISDILDDWESQIPNEKEENAIYDVGGEEFCDEPMALSALLQTNQLFVFRNEDGTVGLRVDCSNVFASCADSEPLPFAEIVTLYKIKNDKWGITKWVCKKRNQRPQKCLEDVIKIDGAWDEEMEALPLVSNMKG